MKNYSIKMVDGSRYDYQRVGDEPLFQNSSSDWFEIEEGPVTRRFYTKNIVSITMKTVEEG